MKARLWVFWYGQFMKFFTPYLSEYFDIQIYDRTGTQSQSISDLGASPVSMQEAAACDYVLLGYPAGSIRGLLEQISQYISQGTVVLDICSVKTPAVEAMLDLLPEDCHIIATHPIFGPQSGKNGIEWLKCTLSKIRISDEKYDYLKDIFWNKMKLKIFEMTPEEHDKEMAYIQGVTHFVGRALKNMNIPDAQLATCSYKDLRSSSETVGYDSDELFLSIQQDNPYVWEVRKKLLEELENQNTWIENNKG